MNEIFSLDKINAGYGRRQVLYEISLRAKKGENILIVGPNGCGKTTLLNVAVGILKPYDGRVFFAGKNVLKLPTHLRMKLGIGFLKQTENIFPSLTVLDNIQLGFWGKNGFLKSRLDWLLSSFPMIKDKLNSRAGSLSGGERQALAICMILIKPVAFLILDEPTAGLSPKAAASVLTSLKKVQESENLTTLMVEHNLHLVKDWVNRLIIMKKGRLVAVEKNPGSVLNGDKLHRVYFE